MPWGKINVKRTYKSFSYCTQWTKSPENINSFYQKPIANIPLRMKS